MKTVGKVSREEAKLIERYVRRCIRLLRKKEYELDLPPGTVDVALRVLEVKRRKKSPSRAGEHLIRINLGYWQVGNDIHTEYASINGDPIIGQVRCYTDEDHWLVATAHEVAHFIQRRYAPRIKRFEGTHHRPHGKCWQDIYRYLRRDYVNPEIEARREAALQLESDERWGWT